MLRFSAWSLCIAALPLGALGASSGFTLKPILEGFRRPVHAVALPGSAQALYVVEQEGRVWRAAGGSRSVFLDIRRKTNGRNEEGLLSIAFPPGSSEGGQRFPRFVYVSYTSGRPSRSIVSIMRVTQKAGRTFALARSERRILTQRQPYSNHNGGHILFGPDRQLYVGFGDGGSAGDPLGSGQNPRTWLGKILRITPRTTGGYSVPVDNPFLTRRSFRREIFALGLRNPWRMSFDRATGRLFAADVGQNRQEEVHVVRGGENMGWNRFEGVLCYKPSSGCKPAGMVAPIHVYPHSQGSSITGGYVYRGPTLRSIRGHYVFADYVSGRLWALPVDGDGNAGGGARLLLRDAGRVSSFAEMPDGELLLLQHGRGRVMRLTGG